jgi:hypothetical protein
MLFVGFYENKILKVIFVFIKGLGYLKYHQYHKNKNNILKFFGNIIMNLKVHF